MRYRNLLLALTSCAAVSIAAADAAPFDQPDAVQESGARAASLDFTFDPTATIAVDDRAGSMSRDPADPTSPRLHDIARLGALQDEPAAGNAADALAADDGWRFEISPLLWAMQMDADLTVSGNASSVDAGFSDIWDHLDFAAMTGIRAQRDRWFVEFAGLYARLSIDEGVALRGDYAVDRPLLHFDIPVEIDADISVNVEQIILQLYLGYELINHPLKDSSSSASGPRLIVSPYGGLRYTSFDIEMDLRLRAAIGPLGANEFFESDQSEDWFDPVIGLDVTFADLGRLTIGGRADIGGFGVGSDFVWSVSARASFELTPNISIFGGYHLLDYDYSDGSGSGKFALDGQLRGPILGVQIRF